MKFSEAMDKLKGGSKITRTPWKDRYFKMVDGAVITFKETVSHFQYDGDIMISGGWSVEGEPEELSFHEIIPYLRQGKRARLAGWNQEFSIALDASDGSLCLRSMESLPFVPEFEAFTKDDWIEV